jgi:transposase
MRLYRGLDHLLKHKQALEKHLKDRLGTLFALEYDLLLYDVTSTYFEGQAALNKKAQRGHSRDNRSDCKQVCIGLVVTKEGYPLGFEVFAGNRADVTTVEDIVETMETRYGKARRIWIWDRGMTSEANLAWMRDTGRPYLVGTPRAELKKWEREFVDRRGWATVRDGLEAKQCQGPDGAETFVLCRSEDRRKKEAAMHERFSERIVAGLESLSRRLQKNQRAAGKFDVRVEMDTDTKAGLRLRYKEKPEWKDWASLTEGAYILRSNVKEWTAEDLWQAYITLTDVEGAFRIHKSDLKIRPIWHHLERRVDAHILVCFLAYALWKTLEGWQKRAGLGSSPRTILDELKKIRTVDVVLPLDNGRDATLRCVVRPDPDQAMLLDRLGLRLPQRLRPTSGDGQM